MEKIILTRVCWECLGQGKKAAACEHPDEGCRTCHGTRINRRPMTPSEQQEHHAHIIGRANQSITAKDGFADNELFFKTIVQESHTFTDNQGEVWAVSLS